MKKAAFIMLGLALLSFGCNNGNNSNEGYSLKGTIKGIPDGTIQLTGYNQDTRTSTLLDSATIENGTFELSGKVEEAQMVRVSIQPGNFSFRIFLENKPLTLKADTTGSQYYDQTQYGGSKGAMLKNFSETGSPNFDAWMQYQNDPGQKKYDPMFATLREKITNATDKDEEYRYRGQMDSLRKILTAWKLEQVKNYIDKNPSSVAGAYMLRDLYTWYSDMPVDDMEGMMQSFEGNARTSKYNTSLENILAKRKAVMPGSVAPDFTLMKRDSSQFTLSSTRGQYVMIDFWASWCVPCRKAIPHWKEVYAKYHDRGFEIVSVSDDSKWSNWFKALDEEQMPWIQVCDEFNLENMPARVGALYMTHYIPFYVLLDKEGKVLVYSGDEQKIDKKLEEIFGS